MQKLVYEGQIMFKKGNAKTHTSAFLNYENSYKEVKL